MSDCLQNEDSIVSDLSSSNTDSLTGTLDSGDNINSDISISDAMVSSISDGDSTDSNLGDDGSLYSELVIGGGGGVKYTGQETDNIVITVDNNVYTISASLRPIKFDSVADFPLVGSEKLIYVDFSNKTLYGWDSTKGVYYKLVADVKIPTKLSEFTNDAGFITNTVNDLVEYYKKTETYSQAEIDSKISAIPKFDIRVVDELPTTDISETTVYLVASESDDQNLYVEYIYVGGTWEKLGEQKLDLSNVVNSINGKTGEVELSAEDVGALPSDTPLFSGDYNDLSNKPTNYVTTNTEQSITSEKKFNISQNVYTQDHGWDSLRASIVLTSKLDNDATATSNVIRPVVKVSSQILEDNSVTQTFNVQKFQAKDGTIALLEDLENAGGGSKIIWREWK